MSREIVTSPLLKLLLVFLYRMVSRFLLLVTTVAGISSKGPHVPINCVRKLFECCSPLMIEESDGSDKQKSLDFTVRLR
jgi:hypothetical protein